MFHCKATGIFSAWVEGGTLNKALKDYIDVFVIRLGDDTLQLELALSWSLL